MWQAPTARGPARRGGVHLVAVEVEELDRAGHAAAEARPGGPPARDDAVERRRNGAEAVAALEIPRGPALGDERGAMLGALDDLAAAPRSGVLGDDELAVEYAYQAVVDC
jgi:hypothetical protein